MKLRVTLVAIAIAAAAALTSCSGSDSDSNNADAPSSAAPSTPDAPDTCESAKAVEADLAGLKSAATSGDPALGYDATVKLIASVKVLEEADIPADFSPVLAAFVSQLEDSSKDGTLDIIVMSKYGDKLTAEGNKISKFIVENCS